MNDLYTTAGPLMKRPMQIPEQTTVDEYLRLDLESETKLEYHAGRVIAMAGASLAHNRLVARLARQLGNRLEGTCEVLASDLRVHITHPEKEYTYPDVVVLCGEPHLTGDRPDTLLNPTLLVEVISEATADADRGWKLRAYMQIESLEEYWIVEQEEPVVTRYLRCPELWAIQPVYGHGAAIESPLFDEALPLGALYAQGSS